MLRKTIGVGKPEERLVTGLPLWKRALDFSIILMLAPALVMLGGLVALAVGWGSRGPIFFRQRRVEYSQRLSLWLNVTIILKTLPALWRQCSDMRTLKREESPSSTGGIPVSF